MAKWRDYNHETDYEAVVLIHERMQQRIGRDFPLPNPRLRPTLGCMVLEDDSGEITHFVLGEAEMELSVSGETAISTENFAPVVERFTRIAQFYNIHVVRMFPPRELLDKPNGSPAAIRRLLESKTVGFAEESKEIASFFKWIPPAEGEAA